MLVQLRNISELARSREVVTIFDKYFSKPIIDKSKIQFLNTQSIVANPTVIGNAVEDYLNIYFSNKDSLLRLSMYENALYIKKQLIECKKKFEEVGEFATKKLMSNSGMDCQFFFSKQVIDSLLNILSVSDLKIFLNTIFKDKMGLWERFFIENSQEIKIIKVEESICDCYEIVGYCDDGTNKKTLTICTLIDGKSFFDFFIEVLDKYLLFVSSFSSNNKITYNDCTLLLRVSQILRVFKYGYLRGKYGFFGQSEIDTFYNLITRIPEGILNLRELGKLESQRLIKFNFKDKVVQGRADFVINNQIILEIKTTKSFFSIADFYQVLLYYFVEKLSDKTKIDYPKQAIIYYANYNIGIKFNIESLISPVEMENVDKDLLKFFKTIKTKR